MQIKVYENSLRAERCRDILAASDRASHYSEVILLPIPTTRDGLLLSGTDIPLLDAVAYADPDTLVVGYGITEEAREVMSSFGASVCDIAEDEGFLSANAELTATAALGIILGSERRAPADIRIGVVGYGRIGKRLTEKLLYHGAYVRVYTGRDSVRLELAEAGVSSGEFPIRSSTIDLDILVNTAPAEVFSGVSGAELEDLRIIDLASGAVFPLGAAVEKYPSVPSRMFPESAGRIWAESVERFLLLGGSFGEV